ncbi:OprD family outer membrane porin [Pseudomonas sp. NFACC39-1]|uniref:OprD family outer membrane porin n=1 Tax=Pseudomonas sp. NFACC39-1 TaxID=1566195 RepID=UPI0008CAE8A7|nr:OprD family outer membrane porin [Pseudomonas sp. NFACC39-1]SEO05083.1 outer membrane porin, OprD family [Pseudomonas sp. NFACC39-1]
MKSTKAVATTYLATLLASGSCFSASISYPDRFQHEGKLNAYLRSAYINTRISNDLIEDNFGGFSTGSELGGLGVGAILDYNSNYWGGVVGFDASLYGVAMIDSEQDSRDLFDNDDGSNGGFAKIGQSYLKLRHVGEGWNADSQIGRGRFDAGTLVSNDTRLVPGSYQGARAHFNLTDMGIGPLPGTMAFEAAYIDRSSPRDRQAFGKLLSQSGEEISNVYTYGVNYDLKAVELSYARGVSKDFNENTRYGLTLQAPIGETAGVILDTQYYRFQKAGRLWEQDWSAGDAAYDKEATWLNVNLGLLLDKLRVGVSFSETKAELSNGNLGYAYFDHADNVDGRMDAWTRSGNDFNNHGERTWQVGAEYDLGGISLLGASLDGFKIMALYKQGNFDAVNPFSGQKTDVWERQNEYRVYYRFDEKEYAGLSVGLIYIDYRIDQDFVALVSAQPNNVVNGSEARVYLDYAF